MRNRFSLLVAASCLASACATTHENAPILNSRGVVPRPAVVASDATGHYGDLYVRFREAAEALAEADVAQTADTGPFLQSGFALIYTDCNTFFANMGRNQRSVGVVRDIIGPVVSLLTGIIALRDFSSGREERMLAALSLWSSAANAGFDIYERRFLFGAENVDSVRELILKALTTHSAAVFNDQPASLDEATIQLIDNHTICTPPHILRLVREAIRKGEIEPTVTGSASFRQEFDVRRALGQRLHPPSPLSDAETFILWQLLIDPRTEDQEDLAAMFTALAGLGSQNPIVETADAAGKKTYAYRGGWEAEGSVVQQLLGLPAETLARFEASMRAAEAAPAAQPSTPILALPQAMPLTEGQIVLPPPPAVVAPPAIRRSTRRVGVSVR